MKCKDILLQAKKGRLALFCLAAAMALYSCQGSHREHQAASGSHQRVPPLKQAQRADSLVVDIIPVRLDEGWGYRINVNHRSYIYQRQIPVISGIHPFPTRETALQVAEIVRAKILKGIDPSVTREELARVLPESLLDETGSGK